MDQHFHPDIVGGRELACQGLLTLSKRLGDDLSNELGGDTGRKHHVELVAAGEYPTLRLKAAKQAFSRIAQAVELAVMVPGTVARQIGRQYRYESMIVCHTALVHPATGERCRADSSWLRSHRHGRDPLAPLAYLGKFHLALNTLVPA